MKYFFPVTLGVFLLLSSCIQRTKPVILDPPPTPILTSKSIWGVVNEPYLKVLLEANTGSEISGVLRRGDIAEIIAKVGDPKGNVYWLEIHLSGSDVRGWVNSTGLSVYETQAQAITSRDSLIP